MNSRRIKDLAIGVVCGSVLVGGVVTASTLVKGDVFESPFPILFNGKNYTASLPLLNYQDRTYVPLRELATLTGSNVDFKNDTIIINNEGNKENSDRQAILNEYKKCLLDKNWVKENLVFKTNCFGDKISLELDEVEMTIGLVYDNNNMPVVVVCTSIYESSGTEGEPIKFGTSLYTISYDNGVVVNFGKGNTEEPAHPGHADFTIYTDTNEIESLFAHMGDNSLSKYKIVDGKLEKTFNMECSEYLEEWEINGIDVTQEEFNSKFNEMLQREGNMKEFNEANINELLK